MLVTTRYSVFQQPVKRPICCSFVFFLLILYSVICGSVAYSEVKVLIAGHVYPMLDYPEIMESFSGMINQSEVDAVFFLGDLVHHGDEQEWQTLNTFLGSLTVPYYACPGNHDLLFGNKDRYLENIGYLSKAVTIGEYKFVLLNSIPNTSTQEHQVAGLDEDQIELLSEALSNKDKEVILLTHNQLWKNRYEKGIEQWQHEIEPMIKDKIKYIFAGDWTSYLYEKINGISTFTIGFSFSGKYGNKVIRHTPQILYFEPKKNIVKLQNIEIHLTNDWYAYSESVFSQVGIIKIIPFLKKIQRRYVLLVGFLLGVLFSLITVILLRRRYP